MWSSIFACSLLVAIWEGYFLLCKRSRIFAGGPLAALWDDDLQKYQAVLGALLQRPPHPPKKKLFLNIFNKKFKKIARAWVERGK